jgi:formylglycine-generating enzyme required for sulfatase activity
MSDMDPIPLDDDEDAAAAKKARPKSPDPFGLDEDDEAAPELDALGNPIETVPKKTGEPVEPPKPLPRLVRMNDPGPASGTGPGGSAKAPPSSRSLKPKPESAPAPPRPSKQASREAAPSRTQAPLPRSSYAGSSASSSAPSSSPSRRSKRRDDDDATREGVLEEPTPEFDTIEARQTIRNIVAGVLVLVAAVFLGSSLGLFRSDPRFSDVDIKDPSLASADPVPPASGPKTAGASASSSTVPGEREAQMALDDARAAGTRGDTEGTVKRLKLVAESYPKTAAGKAAREALERGERGLPLFVSGPVVVAQPAEPAKNEPSKPADPADVVVAAPEGAMKPGGVATAAATAPAPREIIPPPTASPEAYRDTGLNRPRAAVAARGLPAGFRAREEAGVDASGWPLEITGDKDGAAMVFIPGGSFTQGRDDGPESERPSHRVRLSPYYIDQHEVTIRQYRLFTLANARPMPGAPEGAGLEWPVTGVSARDALEYAQWAGKTLPTEAQWEFAARTTDGRLHPWGPRARPARPANSPVVGPIFRASSDLSPYGVYDLAGNAREWTLNWYDPRGYEAVATTVAIDPVGPPRKNRAQPLTIKGGSPVGEATWRAGQMPESRSNLLGFRCVLPLTTPGPGPAPGGGGAKAATIPF